MTDHVALLRAAEVTLDADKRLQFRTNLALHMVLLQLVQTGRAEGATRMSASGYTLVGNLSLPRTDDAVGRFT